MRAFVKALLGAIATVMFVLLCLFIGTVSIRAQAQGVTDKPITSMPQTWTGVVVDVTASPFSACVAGWERSQDKYGPYLLRKAFVDCGRLNASQCAAATRAAAAGDLAAMAVLRTSNAAADPALQRCLDKLEAPPPTWVVAPIASGKRPAYLLNEDGSRGRQLGTADTMLEATPMWCNCRVRSIETTSSTYCSWATARQTFDVGEPKRVTLCRATK